MHHVHACTLRMHMCTARAHARARTQLRAQSAQAVWHWKYPAIGAREDACLLRTMAVDVSLDSRKFELLKREGGKNVNNTGFKYNI